MDLSRLLRPKTIAVVGGLPAAEVVRQSQRMGFSGDVWHVHPKSPWPRLADLPGVPDAVFLAVNRVATVDFIRELAAMGAGGAVAYAAGFAEAGAEGVALQAALRDAAGAMPVLGPNCYGLINYLDGALLWPDQHGGGRVERGVAIVTQSGNIGCNISMQRRGLPIAYLVTLGNQAVVGLSAVIETLAHDERVSAIGLHIEGFDDPASFADAAVAARARGKPIVALKTGGSAQGARLTISHTASLSGADAVASAFLKRIGVARVQSIPALLETLKLLHVCGPLDGGDIASMSCSGGEAALIADRAVGRRIRFRPLDAARTQAVAATLPALVTVSNPLDYHTFSWANREALTATFTAMLRQNFDLTALILDYPREDRCDAADWATASDALIAARRVIGGKAAIIATLPECLSETRAVALMAAGIAPLLGIDEALAAIEAAADLSAPRTPMLPRAPDGDVVTLDEARGKRALAEYGVAVPSGGVIENVPGAAGQFAAQLGLPVVLKASFAHKTEHNAVRLDLRDVAAVADAAADLARLSDHVLVERMVTDAVAEIIVGVARDPAIGPYLMLGSGGVFSELIGDTAILMLPANEIEIREVIAMLKVAKLIAGYRGKPAGDMDALVRTVLAIQAYAVANLHRLLELDVNPVLVCPRGAVAVDALIRLMENA